METPRPRPGSTPARQLRHHLRRNHQRRGRQHHRCHHDPDTLGKNPEGYKANGVIHWVSAKHALDCEIRNYDRLFSQANPMEAENFLDTINPQSLTIITGAKTEPAAPAEAGTVYQFERLGYYAVDPDSTADKPVFNRTVELRDGFK